MAKFEGVMPALITPFSAAGSSVDEAALRRLVDYCIDGGVSGLVPGGSTGEVTSLKAAARRHVTEIVVSAAAGRVPTIAGTGAMSTAETIELSVHAERAGAAAVMVVPPFYDAPGWPELKAHFAAVADALSIRVMYYNIPSVSGVTVTAAQLRELPVTCLKD